MRAEVTDVAGVQLDKGRAFRALEDSVARYTAALRDVKDPHATAIGHWSAADVATHSAQLWEIYVGIPAEGAPHALRIAQLSQAWDDLVKEEPGVSPAQAADRIERATKEFVNAVSALDGAQKMPWYEGTQVSVAGLAAILVQEAEVHGFDIGRSQSSDWSIPRENAAVSIAGLQEVIPHFVNEEAAAEVHACIDLRVRGGDRYFWVFDGPKLTVEAPSSRRVDVHMSVDPVAYLLVGYSRISQWGEIAKGRLFAWGRKPILALNVPKLLRVP